MYQEGAVLIEDPENEISVYYDGSSGKFSVNSPGEDGQHITFVKDGIHKFGAVTIYGVDESKVRIIHSGSATSLD